MSGRYSRWKGWLLWRLVRARQVGVLHVGRTRTRLQMFRIHPIWIASWFSEIATTALNLPCAWVNRWNKASQDMFKKMTAFDFALSERNKIIDSAFPNISPFQEVATRNVISKVHDVKTWIEWLKQIFICSWNSFNLFTYLFRLYRLPEGRHV